jgi:N-acyl-phosphatidylethanolamine-hydrolysing phospholipase D
VREQWANDTYGSALAAQPGGPPLFVVPLGVKPWLAAIGIDHAVELDWWQSARVGAVEIVFTPAQHWSGRSLGDRMATLWGSYAIFAPDFQVWFAGDTDLFAGMSTLAPGLDVALLPVAGWGPRVGPGHLDPERAAEALALLQPRVAIPIHWGTYRRIGMPRDAATLREPAEEFARRAGELAPAVDVRVLAPGERLELA